MKQIRWYVFAGTRGGPTRAQIVCALKKRPMNAHQLAQHMKLDYKTASHHLNVLLENQMVSVVNKGKYGAVYFVSESMNELWGDFGKIWENVHK